MEAQSKKKNILYVEDDKTLAFVTKDNLERFGYCVTHYENGQIALSNFEIQKFSLCILDIMLPKMDGFELAKRIRKIDCDIPILFLSAKSQTEDRIQGLEIGGDDYITKPFSMEELRLKIEVFLKRDKVNEPNSKEAHLANVGAYLLDTQNLLLKLGEEQKKLTQREAKLINMFFQNQNKLIKREELLLKIWGDDSYFNGRSLDVFVSRIRKYLSKDASLNIENVRSIGFRLNVSEK